MKKSLKRIFAGLLSAVTLGCCLPAATLGANAEEAAKTYPREFSYSTNGVYGWYFYPEENSDGSVTGKVHYNAYGTQEGDIDVSDWTDVSFGATSDGYLKLSSSGYAVKLNGLPTIHNNSTNSAMYVVVRYRIVGQTLTRDDSGLGDKLCIAPDGGNAWNCDQNGSSSMCRMDIPMLDNCTVDASGWTTVVYQKPSKPNTGDWLINNMCVQFAKLTTPGSYYELDFIGFCGSDGGVYTDAVEYANTLVASIEKQNQVVSNTIANRRYGDSAIGLYFNPASSGSALADLTITAPAGSGVPALTTMQIGAWGDQPPVASTTEDGYVKLTEIANGNNEFIMRTTTNWSHTTVKFDQAKYTIVRLKRSGAPVAGRPFCVGSGNSWNKHATDFNMDDVTVDADGWITFCVENTNRTSGTELFDSGHTINVQLPNIDGNGSSYVLDYVGFCATEQAKNETLAAIALANSVELVGVQTAAASGNAIRFVGKVKAASVDALNAAVGQLGFKLSNGTQTVTAQIDKVYKSIVAGGETLTADEGEYFFTFVVSNVPTDAQVDFTVTAYVTAADAAGEILANSATVGYDAANNRLVKAKKN